MTNHHPQGGLLRRFARDQRGTIALWAGLTIIPMLIAAGTAIDMARASAMKAEFQNALDGAALALAASDSSDLTGLDETEKQARLAQLKIVAQKYVDQNYQPDFYQDASVTVAVDIPEDGTIEVTGEHDYPTTIMRIVGINYMDVTAAATVEKKREVQDSGTVEVAIALDTTGSMSGQKLTDAKAAAKDLLNILFNNEPTSEYVKAALVPFAQTVNVGTSNATASWLDTTGLADYSDDNFINTSLPNPKMHNMRAWSVLNNRPWTGCVEARKGSYDTNDTAPDAGTPDTLFTPWFAPDEPSSNTSDGYQASWYTNSWSSDGTVADPKTADKRQRNRSKYAGQAPSTSNTKGPWKGCKGTQPIVTLTNLKATLDTAIDALTAQNYTHVVQGLMWGWRVLSPNEPFSQGVAYDTEDNKKILVLMTDGANTYPREGDSRYSHNKSEYSAYGHLNQNRLGTTSYSSAIDVLDSRLATACGNAKTAGIEVWTVAFDLDPSDSGDAEIIELLEDCATSPDKFLLAPDGATLRQKFKAIGEQIVASNLYLAK
jgi:Flp pilus assembly protein TadG